MIKDLSRATISPATALAALHDLIKAPPRRSVQLNLRQAKGCKSFLVGAKAHYRRESSDTILSDDEFHPILTFRNMTIVQAKKLAMYGLQPILERLMVPPSELGTRESNWLQKSAVTLAAESDPDFRIRLRHPQFLLDQST